MKEDAYQGRCAVAGAFPPWLRGALYRAGPGLWEVGERQLRHTFDGFALIGTLRVTSGGAAGPAGDLEPEVFAHQRFVDNEPYRAARRGRLIVDKFASRRRFEGWGAWAQDRIRVRGLGANCCAPLCTRALDPLANYRRRIRRPDPTLLKRSWPSLLFPSTPSACIGPAR